jgi:glycosyltransferase involved in cell wall biosynthesis
VIEATDVFVLASSFEPWGMVVQEFAAAGFPLILSHVVGCAPAMLEEGVNGFSFKANDSADLKGAMLKMMSKSENDLKNMGQRSVELAMATDAVHWSKTLSVLAAV